MLKRKEKKKREKQGFREVAQQLKAPAALPEDPDSGDLASSHRHICRENTIYAHKINIYIYILILKKREKEAGV